MADETLCRYLLAEGLLPPAPGIHAHALQALWLMSRRASRRCARRSVARVTPHVYRIPPMPSGVAARRGAILTPRASHRHAFSDGAASLLMLAE